MKVKFNITLWGIDIPIILNVPSALENDLIEMIENEYDDTPLTNDEFNDELSCHLEDSIDREISKAESMNFEIVDPVKELK